MKNKLVIGVVLVVLAAGGFFLFNSKSSDSNKKTESKTSETQKTSLESSSSKTSAVTKNDCTLYTKADIEGVWGVTIGSTEETKPFNIGGSYTNAKEYNCHYDQTNTGKGLSFVVKIRNFASEADAKQDLENVKNGTKIGDKLYFTLTPVSGVGDEAFYSVNETSDLVKKNQDYLYVRKGNQVFHFTAVNLEGLDHTTSRDKTKAVAKLKV